MFFYKYQSEKLIGFICSPERIENPPEGYEEITEQEYAAYLAAQAKPQD